jgi:hypothetical protein
MDLADAITACHRAACEVLEDLRTLWEKTSAPDIGEYLLKINDTELSKSRRHPISRLTPLRSRPSASEVRETAKQYEKHDIPVPFWMRVYPACCDVADAMGLTAQLNFLAIAVDDSRQHEVRAADRPAYSMVIGPGGLKPLKNFGTYNENGKRREVRTFARLFYDLAKHTTQNRDLPLPSYWGVRIRVGTDTRSRKRNEEKLWMEVVLGSDRGKTPNRIEQWTPPAFPFKDSYRKAANNLLHDWAHGGAGSDSGPKIKTRIPHVQAYAEQYRSLFEGGLPQEWEAFMCPAFFWAPEATDLSSAASIFWGFKGSLTTTQCRVLLALSQIMLGAVAPVTKMALIKQDRVAQLERSAQMLALLEEPLRGITDSLSAMQSDTQRLRATLYEPSHALFDSHVSLSELFREDTKLKASRHVSVLLKHDNDYTAPDPRNGDRLGPEERQGTIRDGQVVLAVGLLRIFGSGKARDVQRCESRKLIIKKAQRVLCQCERDPSFVRLVEDLRWLFNVPNAKSLSSILELKASSNLTALKKVLFDPFKLETREWDKRAVLLATRPYQAKRLANPGATYVNFEDGVSPVSYQTVLAFVADIAAGVAHDKINPAYLADVTFDGSNSTACLTLRFGHVAVTKRQSLAGVRRLVNCFVLTQPRDWRTTDADAGNFRKPFVDIAGRMLGVGDQDTGWIRIQKLRSTRAAWDVFGVKRNDRMFRVCFLGHKGGYDRLCVEWTKH